MPTNSPIPIFEAAFILFPIFFFGTIGLMIVIAVKNYNKAKSMGKDPFTLQTEVMARIADAKLLEVELSVEEKLTKADELLKKGTITSEEHAELRKNILKDYSN